MKTTRLALTIAPLALVLAPTAATAMPAESAPVAQATSERPVLTVTDVTSQGTARHEQLNQAYTDCLIEAGAPTIPADAEPRPVPQSSFSKDTGLVLDWPAPAGPRAACADQDPVYPPVLEAATNPDFAAMAQTYVACLADGGVHVRLLNDENLDWTWRAAFDVPDDNAEIEDACLVGTFGSD